MNLYLECEKSEIDEVQKIKSQSFEDKLCPFLELSKLCTIILTCQHIIIQFIAKMLGEKIPKFIFIFFLKENSTLILLTAFLKFKNDQKIS